MSQELTLSMSLSFAKGSVSAKSLSFAGKVDVAGSNYKMGTQVVPTTAGGVALDVSGLSNVGWGLFKNNDGTNFVKVLSAVSGNTLERIPPNTAILVRFDDAVSAPAVIADTGSCQIEYIVVER